mmetsp:Transcript_137151/g.382553  ORF Transcript_137151/g.382553 Transcript_137151/m.382553 type:complete len:321 (-) Transcript_137151:928-1890(-)
MQPGSQPRRGVRGSLQAWVIHALFALGAVGIDARHEARETHAPHLRGVLVGALPNTEPLTKGLGAGLAEDLGGHRLGHEHIGVNVRLEEGDHLSEKAMQWVPPPLLLHASMVEVSASMLTPKHLPRHGQGPQQERPDDVEDGLVHGKVEVHVVLQGDLVRYDVLGKVRIALQAQQLAPVECDPLPVLAQGGHHHLEQALLHSLEVRRQHRGSPELLLLPLPLQDPVLLAKVTAPHLLDGKGSLVLLGAGPLEPLPCCSADLEGGDLPPLDHLGGHAAGCLLALVRLVSPESRGEEVADRAQRPRGARARRCGAATLAACR